MLQNQWSKGNDPSHPHHMLISHANKSRTKLHAKDLQHTAHKT